MVKQNTVSFNFYRLVKEGQTSRKKTIFKSEKQIISNRHGSAKMLKTTEKEKRQKNGNEKKFKNDNRSIKDIKYQKRQPKLSERTSKGEKMENDISSKRTGE